MSVYGFKFLGSDPAELRWRKSGITSAKPLDLQLLIFHLFYTGITPLTSVE